MSPSKAVLSHRKAAFAENLEHFKTRRRSKICCPAEEKRTLNSRQILFPCWRTWENRHTGELINHWTLRTDFCVQEFVRLLSLRVKIAYFRFTLWLWKLRLCGKCVVKTTKTSKSLRFTLPYFKYRWLMCIVEHDLRSSGAYSPDLYTSKQSLVLWWLPVAGV